MAGLDDLYSRIFEPAPAAQETYIMKPAEIPEPDNSGWSDWLPKRQQTPRAGSGVTRTGTPIAGKPSEFFNEVYTAAKRAGARFPELVASQAALESGWGKSPSGRNNYFGQKATSKQPGRDVKTKEFIGGRMINTVGRFRDYDTLEESISDHIKKWERQYAMAKDAQSAAEMLQSGKRKYATDPGYVKKLSSILRRQGF